MLLDTLLKARHEAGLTQAQVAKRMGTQPARHCAPRTRAGHRETLTVRRHTATRRLISFCWMSTFSAGVAD